MDNGALRYLKLRCRVDRVRFTQASCGLALNEVTQIMDVWLSTMLKTVHGD